MKYFVSLKSAIFLYLILSAQTGMYTETLEEDGFALDLTGKWKVVEITCFQNEPECASELDGFPKFIEVPSNIHRTHPAFYGNLVIEHDFQAEILTDRPNLVFFISALASVDRVFINDRLIGGIGNTQAAEQQTSIWMIPRQYSFPAEIISSGKNTIRIEIQVYDDFAGIYKGPVKILTEDRVTSISRLPYFLRLFLPIGIFFTTIFTGSAIIFAFFFRFLPREYLFFSFSAFTYIFFALYYVPISLPLPYLFFRKLSFWSGLTTTAFLFLFMSRFLTGRKNKAHNYFGIMGLIIAPLHFLPDSFYGLYRLSVLIHPVVIIYLFSIAGFAFRHSARLPQFKKTAAIAGFTCAILALLNCWDFLVRLNLAAEVPMFNYFSMGYPVLVIFMQIQASMYYKNLAETLELSRLGERVRIAQDLHDVLGAEIAALIQNTHTENGRRKLLPILQERLVLLLENLREVIFVLKGESQKMNLAEKIEKYLDKLESGERLKLIQQIDTDSQELNTKTLSEVYRIFLEAISNSLRYSEAERLKIIWKKRKFHYVLIVSDNGNGFVPRFEQKNSTGTGLRQMKMRAELISARLFVLSKPNAGTLVAVAVKIPRG